ncbi:MAG: hypothetical protein AB7P69_14735 [Candidatus Binatia bacterium]
MESLRFEWDIFISNAHIDNEHYPDIPHGWIDYLHERLNVRLAQLLGKPPRNGLLLRGARHGVALLQPDLGTSAT